MLLLVAPGLALYRLAPLLDLRVEIGDLLGISLITYRLYRDDKRSAVAGAWRTPEPTLHLAELMGGWAVTFLAQRALRHKIPKPGYQLAFGSILLVYQCAAVDFLLDGRLLSKTLRFIRPNGT